MEARARTGVQVKAMGKFTLRLDRDTDPRKPFRSDEQPLPPEKARLVKHQDVSGSRLRFGFTVVVTFILGFGLSAVSFSLFNILFNGRIFCSLAAASRLPQIVARLQIPAQFKTLELRENRNDPGLERGANDD